MLRILRAFAWIRWRMFVNSLERTSARDAMQRVSVAIDRILPLLLPIVMIPSALGLAALSAVAGAHLATGRLVIFQATGYVMLAATIASIAGPILMPAADRTNPVRLLLLPIAPGTLYLAQLAGTLSDPWIFLMLPIVFGLPIGLTVGGQPTAAVVAVAAGVMFVGVLVGLSALTTTVVHLLLRDRRRGELVTLGLILLLPFLGLIPAILGDTVERRVRERERARGAVERPAGDVERPSSGAVRNLPPWARAARDGLWEAMPSQLYRAAVASTTRAGAAGALAPGAALVVTLVVLHGAGLLLFRQALGSHASSAPRRTARSRGGIGVLPAASPAVSAVALALLKLVLRTPRGRSTLLAPLILFVFFALMPIFGGRGDNPFTAAGEIGRAAFIALLTLMTPLPISMNHFAIDRAGLTMTLLAPISGRQIVLGKLLGTAIIVLGPAFAAVALSAAIFFDGHPALWLALALSLPATFVLAAPVTTVLSAVFPRLVDMNSIGSKSNAHAAASLLGMLLIALAALPCLALTLAAAQLLGQPWVAPLFVALWTGIATAIAWLLLPHAVRVFDNRRESLAQLV